MGTTQCQCGVTIGRIYADCLGEQWMLFDSLKVDRSDQVGGYWQLRSDADSEFQWIDELGHFHTNLRDGDWEYWHNTLHVERVPRRDKQRKEAAVDSNRIERHLIRLESWSRGALLASSDVE